MPYAKPKKSHWGPATGRVACGRSTRAPRVKEREAWEAMDKSLRCSLCDEHFQRDGKPRKFNATGLYATFRPIKPATVDT